ncbi:hypothetical protein AUJ46_04205 [Candidatus Peregrinibacteria bacterium CG1_02_54_53]|nr:MAG: hypothetical protein AUJ46_04205 [Candidatus Peregrinibacteria bacterium CG1_02_54_53]
MRREHDPIGESLLALGEEGCELADTSYPVNGWNVADVLEDPPQRDGLQRRMLVHADNGDILHSAIVSKVAPSRP